MSSEQQGVNSISKECHIFLEILNMNLKTMYYPAKTAESGDTQMSHFIFSQGCTNNPKKFQAIMCKLVAGNNLFAWCIILFLFPGIN